MASLRVLVLAVLAGCGATRPAEAPATYVLVRNHAFAQGEDVADADLTPDGRRLVVLIQQGPLLRYDLQGGAPETLSTGPHLGGVACSPDGRWIAVGAPKPEIVILDGRTGAPVKNLQGHPRWGFTLAWSPDSRWIACGNAENGVNVWDSESGRLIAALQSNRQDSGSVEDIAVSPDGRLLAAAGSDGQVRLWSTRDWSLTRRFALAPGSKWYGASGVDFSPDGSLIAVVGGLSASSEEAAIDCGMVRIWRVADGTEYAAVDPGCFSGTVAFDPVGNLLFCTRRGPVVWDVVARDVRTVIREGFWGRMWFASDGSRRVTFNRRGLSVWERSTP